MVAPTRGLFNRKPGDKKEGRHRFRDAGLPPVLKSYRLPRIPMVK
jgi:hypothetical protein